MVFNSDEGNEWEADYECSKAFKEGKEARKNQVKLRANPYPEKTREAHEWSSGWRMTDIFIYIKMPVGVR